MRDVKIRPTTRGDFDALCGRQPEMTCQCITADYRGEPVAIAGVTMTEVGYVMCMTMKDILDAPKIKIWRYAKRMMSMIAQGKSVIYAGADCKYLNSSKFLKKLGFEYLCNDANGGEVFVWRTRLP